MIKHTSQENFFPSNNSVPYEVWIYLLVKHTNPKNPFVHHAVLEIKGIDPRYVSGAICVLAPKIDEEINWTEWHVTMWTIVKNRFNLTPVYRKYFNSTGLTAFSHERDTDLAFDKILNKYNQNHSKKLNLGNTVLFKWEDVGNKIVSYRREVMNFHVPQKEEEPEVSSLLDVKESSEDALEFQWNHNTLVGIKMKEAYLKAVEAGHLVFQSNTAVSVNDWYKFLAKKLLEPTKEEKDV